MTAAGHYEEEVVTVAESASLCEVAQTMERNAVGCVVVVDAGRRPLGVLTDRDLTVRVLAEERDAGRLTAGAVMSRPALTGEATDPLEDVIAKMRSHGLRRIPLVHDGRVVGIVTLDDVLARLGSELDDLGGIARRRTIQAGLSAGLPGFRDEIELRLREARDGVQRNGGRASDFLVREFDALRDRIRRTVQ